MQKREGVKNRKKDEKTKKIIRERWRGGNIGSVLYNGELSQLLNTLHKYCIFFWLASLRASVEASTQMMGPQVLLLSPNSMKTEFMP